MMSFERLHDNYAYLEEYNEDIDDDKEENSQYYDQFAPELNSVKNSSFIEGNYVI